MQTLQHKRCMLSLCFVKLDDFVSAAHQHAAGNMAAHRVMLVASPPQFSHRWMRTLDSPMLHAVSRHNHQPLL